MFLGRGGGVTNRVAFLVDGAQLVSVHYFSALAHHIETARPGATSRHSAYIRAIHSTGVSVELGRFKERLRNCSACGALVTAHEEKETDVAIAVRLLELLWTRECDTVVLVSADSDLSPAIREAARSFPRNPIHCCFPFGRGSQELRTLARKCFKIRKALYVAHQLPDPILLQDGTRISKPAGW